VEQLLNKCSSEGRLYYILDTLDHCPYDNLKVAAIGTLKKQITKSESVPPAANKLTIEFCVFSNGNIR
jgi:hypothetical protein